MSYCVKCRRKTEILNPQVVYDDNKYALKSQCPICGIRKSQYISEEQAKIIKEKIKEGGFIGDLFKGIFGFGKKPKRKRRRK